MKESILLWQNQLKSNLILFKKMTEEFKLGDEVFYMFYRRNSFKGIGKVTSVYLQDDKKYIKVSFDEGKYDIKEFTYDGRLMKNLNVVLFHSQEVCDKKIKDFSTNINIEAGENDKFKIFKALIEARDWYNEGWTPNWINSNDSKSVLEVYSGSIRIVPSWEELRTFHFKYQEIADQFLVNYRYYLEQIKDFI